MITRHDKNHYNISCASILLCIQAQSRKHVYEFWNMKENMLICYEKI